MRPPSLVLHKVTGRALLATQKESEQQDASFVRPVKPPPVSWTVGERALYDARREFELLKLLATDKRAFNTARRLAVPLGQNPSKKQAGPVLDAPQRVLCDDGVYRLAGAY